MKILLDILNHIAYILGILIVIIFVCIGTGFSWWDDSIDVGIWEYMFVWIVGIGVYYVSFVEKFTWKDCIKMFGSIGILTLLYYEFFRFIDKII